MNSVAEKIEKIEKELKSGNASNSLLFSYVLLRLEQDGVNYECENENTIDIKIRDGYEIRVCFDNLFSRLSSTPKERVMDMVACWYAGISESNRKVDGNPVSMDRVIVRVRPASVLEDVALSSNCSLKEAENRFSLMAVNDDFFIAIGENMENSISMASINCFKEDSEFLSSALKNLPDLIENDFQISGMGNSKGKPQILAIATPGELCYSFPMSKPHRGILTRLLDVCDEDIVYFFSLKNEIVHAVIKDDQESINMLKEYADHFEEKFELLKIGKSGLIEPLVCEKFMH